MDKIDFIYIAFFSLIVLFGLSYYPSNFYKNVGIIKDLTGFIFVKPFTLFLVGITGLFSYFLYEIRIKIVINERVKYFLFVILFILAFLYFFEFLWHLEMTFSLFTIGQGRVSLDEIGGSAFGEIFASKTSMFQTIWILLSIYNLKKTDEFKGKKLLSIKKN